MSDDNIYPLRQARSLQGYCGVCAAPVAVPDRDAWPQACPHCRTSPFMLVSHPDLSARAAPGAPPPDAS